MEGTSIFQNQLLVLACESLFNSLLAEKEGEETFWSNLVSVFTGRNQELRDLANFSLLLWKLKRYLPSLLQLQNHDGESQTTYLMVFSSFFNGTFADLGSSSIVSHCHCDCVRASSQSCLMISIAFYHRTHRYAICYARSSQSSPSSNK